MFSKSMVDKFLHKNKALRYGKAFYKFMKLDKATHHLDKQFCDRIYNEESEEKVKAMIISRTDKNN